MGEETEGRYRGGEMKGKIQWVQTFWKRHWRNCKERREERQKKEGERKRKGKGRGRHRRRDAGEKHRRRNI